MKQAMNFRLTPQTILTLSTLEKKMHLSKTTIVEQAVRYYAKNKITKKPYLLDYAGILNEKEAEKMLAIIKSSRQNKDLETEL